MPVSERACVKPVLLLFMKQLDLETASEVILVYFYQSVLFSRALLSDVCIEFCIYYDVSLRLNSGQVSCYSAFPVLPSSMNITLLLSRKKVPAAYQKKQL